ncbi:MAG: DJ-1/PfpI family protein [Oscillospiraceae bacterium]|nr:DJ-1/PfpI family protein [Oscillospiraceae bacterium]
MFLADGFEEMEAIAPVDLLRRAGVAVQTVGINSLTVKGSHGVSLVCDMDAEALDLSDCQGVILPGGPGHAVLGQSPVVLKALRVAADRGGLLAAICAAPSILGQNGYLAGKTACCFPGFEGQLTGATAVTEPVVRDGSVITSRGAGTAVPFALALVSYLLSPKKATEVAAQIQCASAP